jgi:hypothetical protein
VTGLPGSNPGPSVQFCQPLPVIGGDMVVAHMTKNADREENEREEETILE